MSDENGLNEEDVLRTLQELGFDPNGDAPVVPLAELGEDDPLQALDINTHEDIETLTIEGSVEDLKPPEKERLRNVPDNFEEGEAVPDTRTPPNPWSRTLPTLGEVSVSELELEEYTRALMHDQRLELPISLWMGDREIIARVRSLYVIEKEVMAITTEKVAREYPLFVGEEAGKRIVGAEFSMRACVLVQLVSFDGVDQKPYDARPEEGQLPEKSPKIAELDRLLRLRYANTHQAKLQAMIKAVHIFEVKQTILEDAFHNRDFPRPVGAS